jgi:hypothetical protein
MEKFRGVKISTIFLAVKALLYSVGDPDPISVSDSFLLSSKALRIQKKYFFIFFLYLLHRLIIVSLTNLIFIKVCVKILFCKHYFSPLNTFMRKRMDPDPNLYLLLMDLDPQGPKTCGIWGSGSGPGSPTLLLQNSETISGTFLPSQ